MKKLENELRSSQDLGFFSWDLFFKILSRNTMGR